ncbi:diacylglycerol kinase family protein [Pseudobacillus badius]|uniref:diacylglycerol kinase family protein n=1 Tax=Bacillus badius TaxID=1455 RepID=UPI0010D71B68|nr:diacylglycerol kinase family protein [Bacillus badius]MED0664709.1 diacylglycerol kinase family protein [Bacillus badius]TDW05019.1 undecaprenol kinase [Bacillus badius]GLY09998.1 diacylglycerol kinase [Bacillus badius]
MNMDWNGKKAIGLQRFFFSFRYALNGLRIVWQEPNFRFHLAAAAAVVAAGVFFSLSRTEWLFILIMIFGVMTLEAVNTAIEKAVDLVTEDRHPLAKAAKDVAAGAVLLFSLLASLVGTIIFLPKVFGLF